MKRDIKVNYGVLEYIATNLNQYKTALETMESTLENINKKLENENDGKAIDKLKGKHKEIASQISSCKEEVTDLYNIFNDYITDMTEIISPNNYVAMTRVSRNDIYWNMMTIFSACSNVGITRRNASVFKSFPNPFASDEEKEAERRNGDKLDNVHSDITNYYKKLQENVDDMQTLYDTKVIPYENMDDTYKTKAKSLYSKYTNFWEGLKTDISSIVTGAVDLVKGFASSILGLVKGVFDLAKGAVTYAGAGIGIACTAVFGDAPQCLKDCKANAEKYNKIIANVLQDPFVIVEGLSQNVNDAYEEKGICYVTGYAAGEIAQVIILKKIGDKIKAGKAEKAGDAVKETEAVNAGAGTTETVEVADDAGDAVKVTEGAKVESISEKVREAINQAISAGTEETWNEFVKANPGRNIEELSKSYIELVTNQSPWPEGVIPTNSTLKGGDTFEMALDSTQPINSPGNFATCDNIKDINYVRDNLAVKSDWKTDCSKVVTYRVKEGVEIPTLEGPVGPQIDINANKYLPGGGNQIQLLLDRNANKMDYLEVVSVRTIN